MSTTEKIRQKMLNLLSTKKNPKTTEYTVAQLNAMSDADIIRLSNKMPLSIESRIRSSDLKKENTTGRKIKDAVLISKSKEMPSSIKNIGGKKHRGLRRRRGTKKRRGSRKSKSTHNKYSKKTLRK